MWPLATPTHLPPPGQVDIWQVNLQLSEAQRQRAESILSATEWEKTSQRRSDLATLAIASRFYCRHLLASYTQQTPQQIDIISGAKGKPQLNSDLNIQFNVAHKRDIALVAVSTGQILGIDIEHKRQRRFIDLAQRYFADDEIALMQSLALETQADAFYAIWTQKEAFIKAHGKSIFSDLRKFSVSASNNGGLLRWDDGDCDEWFCQTFQLDDDHPFALVCQQPVNTLQFATLDTTQY